MREINDHDWTCPTGCPCHARRPSPAGADRVRARVCAGLLTTCPAVSHLCTPEMAEQFAPIIASLLAEVRAEERLTVYREPEDALLHSAYVAGKEEARAESEAAGYASSYWAKLSPAERSAEMKRRAKKRRRSSHVR